MGDWFYTLIVLLVAVVGLTAMRVPRRVADVVWMALFAHSVGAIAQVLVTVDYYGGGDMIGYYRLGRAFAHLIRLDPANYLPEVVRYTLQQRASLPIGWVFEGQPTASMSGIAAFIVLLTGDSIWSACQFVALASFFAKLAICRVLWDRMRVEHHRRVAYAVLLLPSAVYWTSGLVKEAIAMCGLGALIAGGYALHQRRSWFAAVGLGSGTLLVGLIKPYLLFPLACAMAVWAYFVSMQKGDPNKPVPVSLRVALVSLGLAFGVVLLLGEIFPSFAIERLAEEAASHQEIGGYATGGSTYDMGDPEARTLSEQLVFLPLGLASVLFRPLFFEVRSAMAAVNAVETTALLVLWLVAAYRRRLAGIVTSVLSSPELAFCAVVTLVMGVGVGLTTTNLGTLSRYRVPVMPFYGLLLLTLSAPRSAWNRTRSSAPPPLPGPGRALLDHAMARPRTTERRV